MRMRSRVWGWFCALVALGASSGCRDLSYADPAEANAAPLLEWQEPPAEGLHPLRARAAFEVTDVDGIDSLSLSCILHGTGEEHVLKIWVAKPFTGEVNLSDCFASAPSPLPAEAELELRALAVDRRGGETRQSRTLLVSTVVPSVLLEAPLRAVPGQLVAIQVHTDTPLSGPPSATADGVPVPVQSSGAASPWKVEFVAPGVGADLEADRTSADLETLEALERPVEVAVRLTSTGGNVAELRRTILVSRVLWERPVPAILHSPQTADERPIGSAAGLSVAVKQESSNAGGGWVPAFFDAKSGAFEATLIQPGESGRGFTANGLPLVTSADGSTTRWLARNGEVMGQGALAPGQLVRLADRTCVERSSRDPTFPCMDFARMSFECLSTTGVSGSNVVQHTQSATEAGQAQLFAASGSTIAALGFQECSVDVDTTLWFDGATLTESSLGNDASALHRLLPIGGSGTFALVYTENATKTYVARVLAGGTQTGAYQAPLSAPDEAVLARASGALLHLSFTATTTTLTSWPPQAAAPASTGTFPVGARYLPDPNAPHLPLNAVALGDGRVAVLVRTHDFGRAVIATDPQLRPRWIYRYPRGTLDLRLVSDEAGSALYLVDFDNNHVVALSPFW